jgi:hypothetical protein
VDSYSKGDSDESKDPRLPHFLLEHEIAIDNTVDRIQDQQE